MASEPTGHDWAVDHLVGAAEEAARSSAPSRQPPTCAYEMYSVRSPGYMETAIPERIARMSRH